MTYILLTNDDGVHAPGLYALAMAMQGLVEKVGVIAPHPKTKAWWDTRSLSIEDLPIVETQLPDGTPAIGVGGSPADCVALAALGRGGLASPLCGVWHRPWGKHGAGCLV
jgi:5'-nucleotidase